MKKKITRNIAISLFHAIDNMSPGSLDEATLESVMVNFNAFHKVKEDFDIIKRELSDRLYKDVDKKASTEFLEVVGKYEHEENASKKAELYEVMKANANIMQIYEKHISILHSLLEKEIEIDIEEVDADAFIIGMAKCHKDATIRDIRTVFAPLFKAEKVQEQNNDALDMSELDELLK